MNTSDLISNRKVELRTCVEQAFDHAPNHTKGFVQRILDDQEVVPRFTTQPTSNPFDSVKYGGFPDISYLGFYIGASNIQSLDEEYQKAFLLGLSLLVERTDSKLNEFLSDDIAILGVVDGLHKLIPSIENEAQDFATWLLTQLDRYHLNNHMVGRTRDLACDMLDDRGRLQTKIVPTNFDVVAMDLALRKTWSYKFNKSPQFSSEENQQLLYSLLFDPLPADGDIEVASIRLCALDYLLSKCAYEARNRNLLQKRIYASLTGKNIGFISNFIPSST